MRQRATDAEVQAALAKLPGWELEEGAIMRSFEFADFKQAWAFMGRVAEAAEALDHHPEWTNVYNKVLIRLSTHDADGLTRLDFELAAKIDGFAS
ncbi:MAG: 4a-hydroxytetrahydrobiopterin dehydratase [Planctomycetes bacterium]|nr:4a-hydroxytetrahydrobiopterin dehydratase [Planctomycetota bacterium]